MDTQHRNILLEHIPVEALDCILAWLALYPVSIRITRKRNTKMGDYRAPVKAAHHRISINGDLPADAFLITLVHEIAHLFIWDKYQRSVKPHGIQWKAQFRNMLHEVMVKNVFHPEINTLVDEFSSGRISYRIFNLKLEKKVYELNPGRKGIFLEDIPVNSLFAIHNGRTFIKEEKLRTRYRCKDLRTGKHYLISHLARVRLMSDVG